MSTISALFKKEAARFPRSPENQDYFIYKLDHEARIFLSMGRKEDALKKWQEILDKFPRSPRFEEFETKIKEYLGTSDEQKDLNEAAKSCQFDKYYDKYIEINKFKPGNHNLIANIALRVLNWEGSAGVLSFYEKTKNCNKINKKDSDRTYQPKAFFSRALEEEFQKGSCSLYETLSKQKKKIINLKTWRLATPNCLAICEK